MTVTTTGGVDTPKRRWSRRHTFGLGAVLLVLGGIFVLVRVPGWLQPQEPESAIIHQSRRYVSVGDFARGVISPDLTSLNEFALISAEVYGVDRDLTQRVAEYGWWHCFACRPIEDSASNGLAMKTWTKERDDGSTLVVIAFRGTRADQVDDWISNFRWVTRIVPGVTDEYDVVQQLIPKLLPAIDQEVGRDIEIVTAGHSLGGGLAQQAGYLTGRIRRVYAFDPSPVTGYYDVPEQQRRDASAAKRIYRIYEHGEILAYLRLLMKAFYPVPDRNPEIVELRFNLTKGNFISQHSMADLARALDRIAAH